MSQTSKPKKPFYKKWWFIVIVLLLVIGGLENILGISPKSQTSTASDSQTSSMKSSSGTTKESNSNSKTRVSSSSSKTKSNQLDRINQDITKDLKMQQGWASGTIDHNGNPTTNGTPDESFAWTLLISKITYDKDNDLTVKVNDEFTQASDSEKADALNRVQSLTMSIIGNYKDLDAQDFRDGLFITAELGENSVGQSKILHHKEYSWH